jgi:glutamate-1-semialdehyde 2,1-aminomutase
MSSVQSPISVPGIPSGSVDAMVKRERDRFLQANPTSAKLAEQAKPHWHNGVPMHWMLDWSTPFPLYAKEAKGATLTDMDGHRYDDFCLGDTGSMFGHSPDPVVKAITEQARRGLTYMLSTEDVPEVGRLLSEMFGLPQWQVATTATDANRFVIRWCRAITGRPKVLVFNGCYHGSVDDTFLRLESG